MLDVRARTRRSARSGNHCDLGGMRLGCEPVMRLAGPGRDAGEDRQEGDRTEELEHQPGFGRSGEARCTLAAMLTGPPSHVLELLGVRQGTVVALKDVPGGNGSWLAGTLGGQQVVLRRYHRRATAADLAYEHAVLRYLTDAGWAVPVPLSGLVQDAGLWYCLTRRVLGQPVARESARQRARRGRDLAGLHVALRGLGGRIGQRPGWRAQHAGVTVHTAIDWEACVRGLTAVSPRLGRWALAAAKQTRAALAAIDASELPLTVVHGDFAEWNVHYRRGHLAGVIDFGLTHLDSRPYELAIARTWRAPEAIDAYRAELARSGWPLTALEEAAIIPVYRAFRLDMTAWLDQGRRTSDYDLRAIERQLTRTGTAPP
jgi:Ser/Thr protein kinase RdoA (MazF antagonist)